MATDKHENRDELIQNAAEALKNAHENEHKQIMDFYHKRLEKVLKEGEDINSLWETVQQEAQHKKNTAVVQQKKEPTRERLTTRGTPQEPTVGRENNAGKKEKINEFFEALEVGNDPRQLGIAINNEYRTSEEKAQAIGYLMAAQLKQQKEINIILPADERQKELLTAKLVEYQKRLKDPQYKDQATSTQYKIALLKEVLEKKKANGLAIASALKREKGAQFDQDTFSNAYYFIRTYCSKDWKRYLGPQIPEDQPPMLVPDEPTAPKQKPEAQPATRVKPAGAPPEKIKAGPDTRPNAYKLEDIFKTQEGQKYLDKPGAITRDVIGSDGKRTVQRYTLRKEGEGYRLEGADGKKSPITEKMKARFLSKKYEQEVVDPTKVIDIKLANGEWKKAKVIDKHDGTKLTVEIDGQRHTIPASQLQTYRHRRFDKQGQLEKSNALYALKIVPEGTKASGPGVEKPAAEGAPPAAPRPQPDAADLEGGEAEGEGAEEPDNKTEEGETPEGETEEEAAKGNEENLDKATPEKIKQRIEKLKEELKVAKAALARKEPGKVRKAWEGTKNGLKKFWGGLKSFFGARIDRPIGYGTGIGGTIGLLAGGPLGALGGGAIGAVGGRLISWLREKKKAAKEETEEEKEGEESEKEAPLEKEYKEVAAPKKLPPRPVKPVQRAGGGPKMPASPPPKTGEAPGKPAPATEYPDKYDRLVSAIDLTLRQIDTLVPSLKGRVCIIPRGNRSVTGDVAEYDKIKRTLTLKNCRIEREDGSIENKAMHTITWRAVQKEKPKKEKPDEKADMQKNQLALKAVQYINHSLYYLPEAKAAGLGDILARANQEDLPQELKAVIIRAALKALATKPTDHPWVQEARTTVLKQAKLWDVETG